MWLGCFVRKKDIRMESRRVKRLQKELEKLKRTKLREIEWESVTRGTSETWIIKLTGAAETIYQNEEYRLRFKFPPNYPITSPEVQFIPPAPLHRHIYSNGHICLSILYQDWSPALNVESLCLSILSMLSSAKEKEKAPQDDLYRKIAPSSSKDTLWKCDDNTC